MTGNNVGQCLCSSSCTTEVQKEVSAACWKASVKGMDSYHELSCQLL